MRSAHKLFITYTTLTCFALTGCDADREGARVVPAIAGGTPTKTRPEVGLFMTGTGSCTATLITPKIAITAAHCVKWTTCSSSSCVPLLSSLIIESSNGNTHRYPIDSFTSFSRRGRVAEGTRDQDTPILNSKHGDYKLTYDIALLRLKKKVAPSVARPTSLAKSYPKRGAGLSLWGYGCTDVSTQRGAGTKRYLDRVEGRGLSKNLCPGDSGGPVTIGRHGELVYINSAYLGNRHGGNQIDVFGDTLAIRSLLDAEIAKWERAPSRPPAPPTPSPDPSPAPSGEGSDRGDSTFHWEWRGGGNDAREFDEDEFERELREKLERHREKIERHRERIERHRHDGGGYDENGNTIIIDGKEIELDGDVDVTIENGRLEINGEVIELDQGGRTITIDGTNIRIDSSNIQINVN